jgi:Domain of unknown function (DUF4917)
MERKAMPRVLSFDEAIEASKSGPVTALLGNGFSIAQSGGQFGYSNLLGYSGLEEDSLVRNVFRVLSTVDFEEVMHALEHAATIEEAYGDTRRAKQFQTDAGVVRESLIHAVRTVHPEIRFEIPSEQVDRCAAFLGNFETIFTLNYDLLLYWVMLKSRRHTDGFGLGNPIGEFRTFNDGANCSTYYVHGALHLFLGDRGEAKKRIRTGKTIIDDIASTIINQKQLPIFVAEGTTIQKIRRINSVSYLKICYDKLSSLNGTMLIFGHSASDNDIHIYDAIFSSPMLERILFCVHNVQSDWSTLRVKLARFVERRKDIEICYVDAASAHVWSA